MPQPRPFTQRWADALRDAINGDTAYQAAAVEWTSPIALVLDAAPEFGYSDETAVEFTLDPIRCSRVRVLDSAAVTAPFVLRASYSVWKRIVRGALDPAMAVALRQVTLQGDLGMLMRHAAVAKALVGCARVVPTRFPDEDG